MFRNTDPDTSLLAAAKVNRRQDMLFALSLCREYVTLKGSGDLTAMEFRNWLLRRAFTPKRAESLRRRFSDLKAQGCLLPTGARRDGCDVFKYWGWK